MTAPAYTAPVVRGELVRDPASGRLIAVQLTPEAWRELGVTAGDRVLLMTREGDAIAAEVVRDAAGALAIEVGSGQLVPGRTCRVRLPRLAP